MDLPPNAVLLDANLLLLVVVGGFDPALIGRKRLAEYTAADLRRLTGLIAPFARTLTTPHLLAEVSNLADQCVPRDRWPTFRGYLADVYGRLDERWVPAVELGRTPAFARLGLADAAIAHLADGRTLVLSVDAQLCNLLVAVGVTAQNYLRLRGR